MTHSQTDVIGWDINIEPKEGLFHINLREIWKFRDLYSLLVKRNIIVQYKQTILGPAWYIIQPLTTVLMYMVIFGGIAGIPTDGVPQPLFYLSGICLWQYFASCLTNTSNTFVNNAGIFGKVFFPRLIMPLADITSNLLRFSIQFVLFLIVYVFFSIMSKTGAAHFSWYACLFPILILETAGIAFGIGTIISALTTKYRDLRILFDFVIQLWMYATPIVYPISQAQGKTFMGISLYNLMCLNPITPIIETFKYGFLSSGTFIGWGWIVYSFIFMSLSIIVGIAIFNRVQKNFMDTI